MYVQPIKNDFSACLMIEDQKEDNAQIKEEATKFVIPTTKC